MRNDDGRSAQYNFANTALQDDDPFANNVPVPGSSRGCRTRISAIVQGLLLTGSVIQRIMEFNQSEAMQASEAKRCD
jgi:hypothetical protein